MKWDQGTWTEVAETRTLILSFHFSHYFRLFFLKDVLHYIWAAFTEADEMRHGRFNFSQLQH